jgi:hypothetical protein
MAALAAIGAACGDDDDESTDAAVAASAPTTRASSSPDAATNTADGNDVEEFCQAALVAERAAATEDTAMLPPAFEAVAAAAPAEIGPAVDTVIERFRAGEQDSPEFGAAYGELVDYVKGNCGFGELAVTATEYAFGGVRDPLEAGPVVINFENTGTEFHEFVLLRVNDGVTETFDELLALPEVEGQTKVTTSGRAFAAPGETGFAMIDLQPGRYIAICFLPTGATPENMPQIESGEHQGAPHFTEGMVQEFTVS